MDPRLLNIQQFTYDLPEEKIAWFPLPERDESKLLVYKKGAIRDDKYKNIATHLPQNSLVVFNNTKVVEARLLFRKDTGSIIEIFCLEPDERYNDITSAMLQKGSVYWQCLIGGASKWKHGQTLQKKVEYAGQTILLKANIVERLPTCFIIALNWEPASLSFAELLHLAGTIPIPPYLKREAVADDLLRYQTVYAHYDGSVAAPTAGLHFTKAIFDSLQQKNIEQGFVTLHVGAGTFKPVKSDTMEGHDMHAEFIDVTIELIRQLIAYEGNIFAVGTTSARTLESLYWMGVKINKDPGIDPTSLIITQWEVYDSLMKHPLPVKTALQALLSWMEKNKSKRLISKTQILMAPGYTFKIISGLITNFHQPQSTLLLLVAALIGNDWKKIYEHALENEYRFLSYGDGSLIFGAQ